MKKIIKILDITLFFYEESISHYPYIKKQGFKLYEAILWIVGILVFSALVK